MTAGTEDADVVIEYPATGETYGHDRYGVYAYDTYPDGSVLAGQERRRYLGDYATREEAASQHPGAVWSGGGTGCRPAHIPGSPPAWFDPAAAGESWDGE